MNPTEIEDLLIRLTRGQRPRKGDVLAFTDGGFRWIGLSELQEIQISEEEKDE